MDKEFLIQLTNELYRLTLLFPKKEPLRYKMREIADEILANSISNFVNSSKSNKYKNSAIAENLYRLLEVLNGFFEVAKNQNWVSIVEILRIQEKYDRVRAELKKFFKRPPEEKLTQVRPMSIQSPVRPVQIQESLSERQEKILNFLKQNGQTQVWQLKQIFPEVSKRTLRRDFCHLLKEGKIERIGQRNETSYQLKT